MKLLNKIKKIEYVIFSLAYFMLAITCYMRNVIIFVPFLKIIKFFSLFLLCITCLIKIKQYNIKDILLAFVLFSIATLVYYFSKDNCFISLILVLFAIKSYEPNEVIKTDIIVKITILLLLIVFSSLNMTSELAMYRTNNIRYSFGFSTPNDFAFLLVSILIEIYYLKSNLKKSHIIFFTSILLIPVYALANSRSATVFLLLISIFLLFEKFLIKIFSNKKVQKIISYSWFIFTVLSLIFILLYHFDTNVGIKLNAILSNRLKLGDDFIFNYKIRLFGQKIEFIDYKTAIELSTKSYVLDNSYLRILIQYGIIPYILLGFLYKFLIEYAFNSKNYKLFFYIISLMVYGFVESGIYKLPYNIFIIFIIYMLFNDKNKISKKIESKLLHLKNTIKRIFKDKFYNLLFKNSAWAFFGDTSASILNFIVTFLLIKNIGDGNYGVLVLAQSYMSIIDVILNVQSWKSVIYYGQNCLVNKSLSKFHGYVKLGVILDFSTAVIGGCIAIIISPVIGSIFGWSNEMILCCKIFSITIFSHLAGTSTAILRLMNKFYLVALQKFISALVKLVTLIVYFSSSVPHSLVNVTLIYCLTDIIGNILLVVFASIIYSKKYKIKSIIKSKIPKNSKKFISYTLWCTIGDGVDVPVNYLDVFIVSILGTEEVAIFKVFKQFVSIFKKVTSPVQQSIMPQFSELNAKGDMQKGYRIVIKIRNVILKTILPISIVIGLLSPIWLKIIFSDLYSDNWISFFIYLIVQIFALSYTTIHPYFLSLNKAKKDAFYTFISNLLYIGLTFIFVKKIGLVGAAIGFATQAFLCIYLKNKDIKRTLDNEAL